MANAPATPATTATPLMTERFVPPPRRVRPARVAAHAQDWVYARAQFEAGESQADIAKDIGVSDTAVSLRASREGWVRDPLLLTRIAHERERQLAEKAEQARTEVITITARQQSDVLVRQRADIQRGRNVVSMLLDEVTKVSANPQLFEELGELMASPDDRGVDKLNTLYRRVISITERSTVVNTLATALKTLIMLERQAFDITGALEDPEATRPTADVVRGLDKIMDKFNEVLALQAPQVPEPAAQVLDIEVVNVPRPAEAATTLSTV